VCTQTSPDAGGFVRASLTEVHNSWTLVLASLHIAVTSKFSRLQRLHHDTVPYSILLTRVYRTRALPEIAHPILIASPPPAYSYPQSAITANMAWGRKTVKPPPVPKSTLRCVDSFYSTCALKSFKSDCLCHCYFHVLSMVDHFLASSSRSYSSSAPLEYSPS
jgi:hypothetical protein